ncbi:MAG: hypothetical protein WKG06_01200 [Segetibacter sp.]
MESSSVPAKKGVSKFAFAALVLLTIGLAAFSAYNLFIHNNPDTLRLPDTKTNSIDTTVTLDEPPVKQETEKKKMP